MEIPQIIRVKIFKMPKCRRKHSNKIQPDSQYDLEAGLGVSGGSVRLPPPILPNNYETPRQREEGSRGAFKSTPRAAGGQLPPNLDTPPPAAGRPQAARKRRGPDTPKLSPRAPRTARPAAPRRSRSRRLAAARETRPLPSASHSTPLPAAALPLSPLTARRHFPRSSALNRKLAAQHSASSRCSRRRRRHHKLSSRSRRRYSGGAEAVAAGAEARGPPGYVVSRPRPALPVPGGLARPGRWVVPPGQASVARGRGRVDPGAVFAHLPPGTRGGIRGTGVQP
ncbi:class A basic helix-loop-helix protein 9-like [Globicephala melas]|uniref:class A basic helix-loop-helix protein 9-like n=1 Tax=Globicephala melas TaxID=9731 RepID=UPI0038735F17